MRKHYQLLLNTLCMLLGALLVATAGQGWSRPMQAAVNQPTQLQAVQIAVNLLLAEDEEEPRVYRIYLPITPNVTICVGCAIGQAASH